MTTNIGGDARDMNYRYKMPILQTKIEGRGNGIKTVVVNMVDIAKSLHIHPAYPTKYFGIELGAQSTFNVATERAIVNGAHQAGDLAKLLEKFIAQFILCPNCKLPELKTTIRSSSIKFECAACGASGPVKSAHRLVGYMTRNPPKSLTTDAKEGERRKKKKGRGGPAEGDDEAEDDKAKESKPKKERTPEEKEERRLRKEAKKAKKAKKEEKKAKKKAEKEKKKEKDGKDSESEEDASSSDEDEEETKQQEPKEKAEKDSGDDSSDSDSEDDDGEDWHTDTSKAAIRKRQEAELAAMLHTAQQDVENIVLAAKADNKEDSAVTVLKIFLASAERTPIEIAAELRRLAMSRGLDETQKIKTLLEAIVDASEPRAVVDQFKARAELLRYFTSGAAASSISAAASALTVVESRNPALTLLTCIEDLVGVVERSLLPYMPLLLKQLYEDDVLEEPTLIEWFDAPPESSWLVNREVAAEVRAKASPFIQWLKSAEEESEDEE